MRLCPMCNGNKATILHQLTRARFDIISDQEDDFGISLCQTCGLLYARPCPDTLPFSMQHSYGHTAGREHEQAAWVAKHAVMDGNECVLDIGCGSGALLRAMYPYAEKRIGIDWYASNEKSDGITYVAGNVNDFSTASFAHHDLRFDVATMFHVLEHLQHPKNTLVSLHAMARHDSRLVLEVPILETARMDDISGVLYGYGHLTHFTKISLMQMLASTGWIIRAAQEQQDYCGYRVLCVPGAADADQCSTECLRQNTTLAHAAMERWCANVEKVRRVIAKKNRPMLICAAGWHTELLWHCAPSLFRAPALLRLADNDTAKHGHEWRGIPILSYDEASRWCTDAAICIVSSYSSQEPIVAQLRHMGICEDNIVTLYDNPAGY